MAQKNHKDFLKVSGVSKTFDQTKVLDRVSLNIGQGEFFTLLGPSGCGKTTLLRLIAGFDMIDEGQITLLGQTLHTLPAAKRPINTVFQNYALFPHLTIAENVAFGLERLKWKKSDSNQRVKEVLELVKLEQLALRYPAQLSGGQQQRVALARAIAPSPKILLLDEPLSALDLKLRQAMRLELKRIQKEVKISFIFVTHDQEESLSLSDKVAVMNKGQILQIGSPTEIYQQPHSLFVADFIGEANLLKGKVQQNKFITLGGGIYDLPNANGKTSGKVLHDCYICFRPEHVTLKKTKNANDFYLQDIDYLGASVHVILQHKTDGRVKVMLGSDKAANLDLTIGGYYNLLVDPTKTQLLDQ